MKKNGPILYLNMIVEWDEPVEMLQRALDSVKDYVDGMYIAITYTQDEPDKKSALVKLLKKYNANVSFFKWTNSFAEARQFVLDQTPQGEHTYFLWIDTDDVVRHAEKIPEILQEMELHNQDAVFIPYWYAVDLDDEGNVREIIINQKRERFILNDGSWKWKSDLHEVLISDREENIRRVGREDCVVVHLSSRERTDKNMDRNMSILEAQARKEQHKDPRTLIYLAKVYYDKGKSVEGKEKKVYFDLALNLFHEYLYGSGNPGDVNYREPSGWREERSTAWAHIAEIAILTKNPKVAIEAYKKAIEEAYEFPNYYIDLAATYCMINDYKQARHWLNVGLATPMPKTTIITFPRDLKLKALQVSMEVNMNQNKLDEALQDAKEIVKILPKEDTMKNNVTTIQGLIDFNKACQSFIYLGKYLERTQNKEALSHLVQAMPPDIQNEKFASEMRHLFMPARTWDNNEIAIFCGPIFEKWSPKSLDTGIGGSEEAVIRLSRELVNLGWKVTVFGNPQDDAGEYAGVTYKSWNDFNYKDDFNVLVLWRAVSFADMPLKSKFTVLWMHDVPNNPEFTQKRLDKIDKIAVLSEYHKSLFRMFENGAFKAIPEEKFFLTGNGVPDELKFKWKGNPHRLIYMSSPDRGLIYLLNNWETVRKEVPDAELHVFYGFNVYDMIHKNNPARMQWKEHVMNLMKQPGIVYHGRVGHNALHYEISKSGIWAYPTDFSEIFATNGALAQALGAIPVVTDYAALTETVKNGVRVDVDITDKEGQKEYFDALIKAMKNEEWQADIRKQMIPFAREHFAWSKTAQQWDTLFRVKIQNVGDHTQKNLSLPVESSKEE